ncbi:MAG TPA: hypothetical protein VEW03_02055 [Longimicrobiaceae bacterium]|nr:hypothetical protein [Longimicrobiaceae bacterium]
MQNSLVRRLAGLVLLPLLALGLAGCDDNPAGSGTPPARLAVILNSVENSLTVVPIDGAAPTALTIGLGPQGSPVGLATRGQRAVVPLGFYPFVAVVNVPGGAVERFIPLPANSGATGAAFLSDSIAVVGNSNLNSVTAFNVNGAVGATVAVGTFPQAIVAHQGRLYVINGNLVNFSPAGPGSVTVLNAQLQVVGTVQLTGFNPSVGVVRGGRLYVLNAGHFGGNDGSLSVVDLATLQEERLVTGFGEFPGSIAVGPDGNLYAGVYGLGILVWNPDTRTFVRGLSNPLVPGGSPPVSAVAFDVDGRLHTANPGTCQGPGTAHRSTAAGVLERTVATGICPFFIAFAATFPPD